MLDFSNFQKDMYTYNQRKMLFKKKNKFFVFVFVVEQYIYNMNIRYVHKNY